MNLREQHDAYEFFNTLVDNLDEGLKTGGYNTFCADVLGGSFADQKICKQCPHRFVKNVLGNAEACAHFLQLYNSDSSAV